MVKKLLTAAQYTEKCQSRLHSVEKVKKVAVQNAQRKLLKAKLNHFRKVIKKRQKEHEEQDRQWLADNAEAVRYYDLKPPPHKRWLPPKKMRETFPELFLTLQKCPDCNG